MNDIGVWSQLVMNQLALNEWSELVEWSKKLRLNELASLEWMRNFEKIVVHGSEDRREIWVLCSIPSFVGAMPNMETWKWPVLKSQVTSSQWPGQDMGWDQLILTPFFELMGRFHEFPKQEIKPFSPLESPPVFVRIRLFSQGALSPQSDRLCAELASIYTYRYNKVNCFLFGLDSWIGLYWTLLV